MATAAATMVAAVATAMVRAEAVATAAVAQEEAAATMVAVVGHRLGSRCSTPLLHHGGYYSPGGRKCACRLPSTCTSSDCCLSPNQRRKDHADPNRGQCMGRRR